MYVAQLPSPRTLVKPALVTASLAVALRFVLPSWALAAGAGALAVGFAFWWTRFLSAYINQRVPSQVVLKPVSALTAYLHPLSGWRLWRSAPSLFLRSLHLFVSYPDVQAPEWTAPLPRWIRLPLVSAVLMTGLNLTLWFPVLCFITLLPLLARYAAICRRLGEIDTRSLWEREVEACDDIPDHVYLGRNAKTGEPILLPFDLLGEHCLLKGPPGTTKSQTLLGIVLQIIRRTDYPVVVIVAKDDPAFRAALHIAAHQRAVRLGRESTPYFQLFHLHEGYTGEYFNGLAELRKVLGTPRAQTDVLLQSLGKDYGAAYGAAFFFNQNRLTLHDAITLAGRKGMPLENFGDLLEAVRELKGHDSTTKYRDSDELISSLETLRSLPKLNPHEGLPLLDWGQVLDEGRVVLVYLPTSISEAEARESGGLFMHSLYHTVRDRMERTGVKRPAFLCIDESHVWLRAASLSVVFEQARQKGLGVIATLHHEGQLTSPEGRDFQLVAKALSSTQITFAVRDARAGDELLKLSGEKEVVQCSTTDTMTRRSQDDEESVGIGITIRPVIRTLLEWSDLVAVNGNKLLSILQTTDWGFARTGGVPTVLQTCWPLDPLSYYRELEKTPWPVAEEVPPPAPEPKKKKKKKQPEWQDIGPADGP